MRQMIIGKCFGNNVVWIERTACVKVARTCILMTGARTLSEALDMCNRNLNNFKKVKGIDEA